MGIQIELRMLVASGLLVAPFVGSALADEPWTGSRPEFRTIPELIAPAPPDDGSQPACKNPRKYVELLDAHRNTEVSALFAENAVHYGPDGVTRRGRKAIAAFYAKPLPKGNRVYVTFAMQHGRDCILELASGAPGAPTALRALDHYKVNAQGEIEWMLVFVSPAVSLPRDQLAPDKFLEDKRP
jgi:hypothetical protein